MFCLIIRMCWLFCIMNAQISQHNLFVSDSYKINQSINQSSKLSCSDQFEVALTCTQMRQLFEISCALLMGWAGTMQWTSPLGVWINRNLVLTEFELTRAMNFIDQSTLYFYLRRLFLFTLGIWHINHFLLLYNCRQGQASMCVLC